MKKALKKILRHPAFHFCLAAGIVAQAVIWSKKYFFSSSINTSVRRLALGDGAFVIHYPWNGRTVIQYPAPSRKGKKFDVEVPATVDEIRQLQKALAQ